jgi:type I restriction enzyme R subunit
VAPLQAPDRWQVESRRLACRSICAGKAFDRGAIEEFETANGPADYAFCLDSQVVAILEAKKLTLGPQNVFSQAERYSRGIQQPRLQAGSFGVPLLYSTNSEVIWHHDVRNTLNRSRQITDSYRIDYLHTPTIVRNTEPP